MCRTAMPLVSMASLALIADVAGAQLQLGTPSSGWLVATTNPTNSTSGSNQTGSGGGSTGGGIDTNYLFTSITTATLDPNMDPTGAFARFDLAVHARFLAQGVFTDSFTQQPFMVSSLTYFQFANPYGSLPPSGSSTTVSLTDGNGATPAGVLMPGVQYKIRIDSDFVLSGAPFAVPISFDHSSYLNLYSTPIPAGGSGVLLVFAGMALGRRSRR